VPALQCDEPSPILLRADLQEISQFPVQAQPSRQLRVHWLMCWTTEGVDAIPSQGTAYCTPGLATANNFRYGPLDRAVLS